MDRGCCRRSRHSVLAAGVERHRRLEAEPGGEAVARIQLDEALVRLDLAVEGGPDGSVGEGDLRDVNVRDRLAPLELHVLVGVAEREVEAERALRQRAALSAGQQRAARGVAGKAGRAVRDRRPGGECENQTLELERAHAAFQWTTMMPLNFRFVGWSASWKERM